MGGAAALIVLWIVVYWLWEPGGGARDAAVGPPSAVAQATGERASGDVAEPVGPVDPVGPIVADGVGDGERRVEPPEFREYTVRDGDRMDLIAQREYGSTRYWTAIARANPLLDPNRLRPGRVIRLPVDPGNVQGRVVSEDGTPEDDGAVETRVPDTPTVMEYRVARGDTLGGIAQKFYGSTAWTDFLFQANRDRLSSPGAIRIGQTLRVPPKPAGDAP